MDHPVNPDYGHGNDMAASRDIITRVMAAIRDNKNTSADGRLAHR